MAEKRKETVLDDRELNVKPSKRIIKMILSKKKSK